MKTKLTRERRRSLTIRVVAPGEILVKAPIGMNSDKINDYIGVKMPWIERVSMRLERDAKQLSGLMDGNEVMIGGARYLVEYANVKTSIIAGGEVIMPTKCSDDPIARASGVKRLCIDYLSGVLEEMFEITGKTLGVRCIKLSYNNAKTQWGNCNSRGEIRINWRAAMLTPDALEYLAAHELCHLIHMNHSAVFWSELERIMQDYKLRKKHVKDSDYLLKLYR